MRERLSLLADLVQIGQGVGAVRHCVFSTGPFVEPITAWDEPRRLEFAVTQNPPPMHEWSPYRDLTPRHLHGYLGRRGAAERVTPTGSSPIPPSTYDARQGQFEALKRAAERARAADPSADVRIRVSRRVSPTGNTADESFRRWLHLVAENMSATIAHRGRLRLRIQRETKGDERPAPIEREWMWTGIREEVDLRQGMPIEIPVVVADVAHPSPPLLGLAPHEHLQPVGRWWITPEGHRNLTRHDELPPGRYWLEVTLSWTESGSVRTEPPEHFLLVIPENRSREAELIHTVSSDRY